MKNLTNKSLEFSDLKKLLLKKNLLSFNRKIKKAHVRDMANSIMNCGLLRDPIIGDVSSFDHRRKYVIIIIFTVAAVLTPPDPITQIGLGIPLLILYELSILSVRLIENKKNNA